MNKIFVVCALVFTLTACSSGGGGGNPPTGQNPNPVLWTTGDAERVAVSLANAFIGLQEAQVYPMVLIIGDMVSNNPTTTNPHVCLNSGSYILDFVDTDGSGNISSGESSDIAFTNCNGSSSTPVNGSIHQELYNFDADFTDSSIIATTIRRWNASYTFTNLNRFSLVTQEQLGFSGEVIFDYQVTNAGWTQDTDTVDLMFSNSFGSVFMRDLSIDYVYDQATDTLTANLSGSIQDASGIVTVAAGSNIVISNYSSNTPTVSGSIEASNGISTVYIAFQDLMLFDLSLDANNDGVIDATWQYSFVQPNVPFTLEGVWDVYQGGVPSINNETVEFFGNQIFADDDSGALFSGTFVDTSDASTNRLQITVTYDLNPAYIGLVSNCIYQYDGTGLGLTLACREPGTVGYPANFMPAVGVAIFNLVKQ